MSETKQNYDGKPSYSALRSITERKKLLLEFGIIQIIGLIFKFTLGVRLLLVYKRLQSFSYNKRVY